ncbi:hypothetical protein [Oerskovia flava]|uniref:hypothetical protein n=1 Tax=Oerskovia flava TaxID=2986422 RepID=UPI002240AAA1|nr:hypothetical protein [Oerskovia sp. JB1-3-2]
MNRRGSRRTALVAAVVLIAGVAVGGTLPAGASEAVPALPGEVDPGPTCTVGASPALPGQDPATVPDPVEECFDSLAEALSHVTGLPEHQLADVATTREGVREIAVAHNEAVAAGADRAALAAGVATRTTGAAGAADLTVKNGSTDLGAVRATGALDAVTPSSSILLGFIAKGSNWTGATRILWGTSGNGCRTGSTYGFPNMRNVGYNNVISSAESYSGCWGTYYDEFSYKGARRNCTPTCSTMGVMDNRTSSIVYRPAGTLG